MKPLLVLLKAIISGVGTISCWARDPCTQGSVHELRKSQRSTRTCQQAVALTRVVQQAWVGSPGMAATLSHPKIAALGSIRNQHGQIVCHHGMAWCCALCRGHLLWRRAIPLCEWETWSTSHRGYELRCRGFLQGIAVYRDVSQKVALGSTSD